MKPIKDRSDEELNRTIAEWEGWMFIPSRDIYISGQLQAVPEEWESPDGNYRDASPNYTSDLNACHEAEKKWCGQDGPEDGSHPRFQLSREVYNIAVPYGQQPFRATARQRAEALVAVIEQQKGEQ